MKNAIALITKPDSHLAILTYMVHYLNAKIHERGLWLKS